MKENKRILLLALGIAAMVVSDPPVASYFERPQSVCRLASDLAVSAFDTLVRSTLPLPSSEPEIEQSDEILVSGPPTEGEVARRSGTGIGLAGRQVSSTPRTVEVISSTLETINAVPVKIDSKCSGSSGEPVEMLRVEAVMEVTAEIREPSKATVEHG